MKHLSEKQKWERINTYIIAYARIQGRVPRVKWRPHLRLIYALGDVLYEEAERLIKEVQP